MSYNVVLIKTNGLTVTFSDDTLRGAAARALRSIQDCDDREDEFRIVRFFFGSSDGWLQEYTVNELKEFAAEPVKPSAYPTGTPYHRRIARAGRGTFQQGKG